MLNRIIEDVSARLSKAEGKIAVLPEKGYTPIEFSAGNYREIGRGKGNAIVFVDGGNSELVKTANLSLQAMRVAAVVVKGGKITGSRRKEFYVLATESENNGKIERKAKIYDNGNEIEVTEAGDGNSGKLVKMCESIRKCSEIKLASEMAEECGQESIVVLDGTLEAANEMEKRHYQQLYHEAGMRNVMIAAVAKTSALMTDKGDSFAALVNENSGSGCWHYYPVAKVRTAMHLAEMFFAKLNESSRHVFRCEVYKEQAGRMAEVAAELRENSRDLSFPGYPYGLVMADKLARVSDREAGYLRAKLFTAAGKKWQKLESSLSAVNAHEILDSI